MRIAQVELSDRSAPGMDEIKVWTVPLDGQDPTARRRQANTALREVLAGCLHRAPSDLTFGEHPGGKPRLACGELEFNLSHSGAWAMFAVSLHAPLGIDLERPRTFVSETRFTRLVERICSPAEQSAVHQAHNPHDFLLRLWVRKEAVVKASGHGVGAGERLPELDVLADHAGDHVVEDLRPLHAGYHAALAYGRRA